MGVRSIDMNGWGLSGNDTSIFLYGGFCVSDG